MPKRSLPRSRLRCPQRRRRAQERGAVAVEFAIVLPLLVMLVLGMVNLGIVMAQKASLASAVRDGARYGSVSLYAETTGAPRTCSDVVGRVRADDQLIAVDPSAIAVQVSRGSTPRCSSSAPTSVPPCADATENETLYVRATYESRLEIPFTGISMPLNLESTGAYRCEYH